MQKTGFKKNGILALILGATALFALPFTNIDQAYADKYTVTYPYYGFIEDSDNPWETVYDALDETGTVEFNDDFFLEPSPGIHPELRALSYALALAGYENKADGYPSSTTTPNPKLTDLLNQMGFSDYQYWDLTSEADGHSMGTTIGHKTLPSGQELIVVAPRNYNYMTEWLSNFNVGTSGDHNGFAESANFIVNRFTDYVTNRNLQDYKVWTVGYSRGGAVTDLFAKYINADIDNYDLNPDDFYVYTFGAPKASITETNYANIHDVKDGNDLLLGYVFPATWGFYNTGVYEEIHPADLSITTSVIDISDLADSTRAMSILTENKGITREVGEINGQTFMDQWFNFVTTNGLTREYFDTELKAPLSAIMKLYQTRPLDQQGEFTGFLSDTSKGLAGMVAGNAFMDLLANYGGVLSAFPTYNQLVSVLKGTATDTEVESLITTLTGYMGEYDDYETNFNQAPAITRDEFASLKENLPKLIKALMPLIIADAAYTQATYGDDYSLYYTYTLASNAESLVYGHIPESIMPILKSMIPAAAPDSDPTDDQQISPNAPKTGYQILDKEFKENTGSTEFTILPVSLTVVAATILLVFSLRRHQKR